MKWVPEQEVLRHLSPELAFAAVREALIAAADGTGTVNPVVMGSGFGDGDTYGVKSGASRRARIIGLKVGTYWPGNRRAGLAAHGSTVVLLDPDTGSVRACIDASRMNGPRTAAADAVAASVLARPDSSVLTILGAGHQSECEARAVCRILPIRQIYIVNRDTGRAASLAERLAAELGLRVAAMDARRACTEADVLVTVTAARAPLFDASWLRPGTHVAAMGCDQSGKQELPVELLRRSRLFCDLPAQSVTIGEYQHIRKQIESGELSVTAIGDVLGGRAPGRVDAHELTVFDSSGIALQDLYVASEVMRAVEAA